MEDNSFVRWQQITIGQLGYALNLVLGLCTASLGFAISLLTGKDFAFTSSWGEGCYLIAVLTFLVSIGLGIWCTINRLLDFRTTSRIARLKQKNGSEEELVSLRTKATFHGSITWKLFWWHLATFAFAVISFVASILLIYRQKL